MVVWNTADHSCSILETEPMLDGCSNFSIRIFQEHYCTIDIQLVSWSQINSSNQKLLHVTRHLLGHCVVVNYFFKNVKVNLEGSYKLLSSDGKGFDSYCRVKFYGSMWDNMGTNTMQHSDQWLMLKNMEIYIHTYMHTYMHTYIHTISRQWSPFLRMVIMFIWKIQPLSFRE